MVILSFAKNKFPIFFFISQIQPHQVLLVFFTQNMDQKKLPHKKSAKITTLAIKTKIAN